MQVGSNPVSLSGVRQFVRVGPYAGVPALRKTPRVAEPAWHRAARRQRSQDRALVYFAKATQRLDHHHGSSSGMAWADVVRKPSLNQWLREQGFVDEVVDAVQKSRLASADIDRLKQLRKQARGQDGKLSHAQQRSLKASGVRFKDGKLLHLTIDSSPGGALTGDQVRAKGRQQKGGDSAQVASLQKQVAELTALVKKGMSSMDEPMGLAETARHAPDSTVARTTKGKACHVCGSKGHLKADCPQAQVICKLEQWLDVLTGGACLLPSELKDQQVQEVKGRLEALRAETAQAKEQAILPEHLVSTRRAEAKRRYEALAAARQSLEQHESLMAEMQAEEERLRQAVAAEAMAYKQAEAALESAQRRMAETAGPQRESVAAPREEPAAPRPPALSQQGAAALELLRSQLAGLGSVNTVQDAEAAHQRAIQEATTAGQAPPSALAFVLDMLGKRGLEQLELVRFDIAKQTIEEVPAATAPSVPAAERPTAVVVATERPRREGGLGDNPRLPQRDLVKELPPRGVVEAAALARRVEARAQLRAGAPTTDPLWAAVNTIAGTQ